MVNFVSEKTAWRTAGAPRRLIPDEIQTWMDETYAHASVCELPRPAPEDEKDFLGLLRLYAKRKGKTVYVQEFTRDGAEHIRFMMRDPRPYTRSNLPREKR